MSAARSVPTAGVTSLGSSRSRWWLVFTREMSGLWIGGKALNLLTLFSILMGITAYLMATNNELKLIPIKEIAYLMLKLTIAFGLFIGLIIGADAISGERERGTLEGLLLTPTSRRQILLGKFLAALSPWPAAFLISVPLIAVLCRDGEIVRQALLWGGVLGTINLLAFTGFGMLISFWSNSNRTSIFASLIVYLVLLLPTQFPGQAQTGAFGDLLQKWNPLEATNVFLAKVIVNNRTVDEMSSWLVAPILFAVLIMGILFGYAGSNLRLEGGRAKRGGARAVRAGIFAVAALMATFGFSLTGANALAATAEPPLQITVDREWTTVKTGDVVEFRTVVTNNGADPSPSMFVAMNIIHLNGEIVDPEDWSPQRTQSLDPLAPGQSTEHSWTIDAILKGDYMVYMVVIPRPDSAELTTQPVASSGIHLTVTPFTRINPRGVLPLAAGIPVGLMLTTAVLQARRRRANVMGE